MKRMILATLLVFLGISAFADDVRTVFVIQGIASSTSNPWTMNMVVPTEAVRLYAPSRFVKKLFSTDISVTTNVAFSVSGRRELERSETRVLLRYDVIFSGDSALPKPDKRVSVRFSLSELVNKGGPAADSPGFYALRKAVATGPYRSGLVWIESIDYDGAGQFTAVIGFMKP